ncbi:MAG: PLD nuclease N-terminal domain-containing protein [Hyphomonadaceae bacterium]
MDLTALAIVYLIAAPFAVFAAWHVLTSREDRVAKGLWVVFLVFAPVVSVVAWLIAGPRRGRLGSDERFRATRDAEAADEK